MSPVVRVSAAVVTDAAGRALVVRKRGATVFQQPGGKPDPGETAVQAVAREVAEETGIVAALHEFEPLGEFSDVAANEPGHRVVADAFRLRVGGGGSDAGVGAAAAVGSAAGVGAEAGGASAAGAGSAAGVGAEAGGTSAAGAGSDARVGPAAAVEAVASAEIEELRWIREHEVATTPLAPLSRNHLIAFAWR